MNHQPFEDWLLDDTQINPRQKLELDAHLRTCAHCSALAETGNVLRTVKRASPASGFTPRFQARLALQKAAERRRRLWGAVFFTFGGMVILMWLAGPYIASFFAAPATWITTFVGWGVFLLTTLRAVAEAGSVMLRVLPGVLSPFAWMVVISALAGFSLLWSVSMWRLARLPRGV